MLEELLKFDVDSEVFELTVAMLKQQSEDKYQSLIELMFDRALEEFSSNSTDFSVFNILILSMQVIDDALYRKKFLDIIINKKSTILKNIDYIHNLRLLPAIYDNDVESCKEICDAYEDECLFYIFNKLDSIFIMGEEFSEEHEENFFDYLFGDKQSSSGRRQIAYRGLNLDENFYINISYGFLDWRETILKTNDETLLRIYKKFSRRNYKKRTAQTIRFINEYKNFSDKDQRTLTRMIFLNPFKPVNLNKSFK